MILSDAAVALIRKHGPAPFDLESCDDRIPVVAYVRLTDGRIFCPEHSFWCADVSQNDRANGPTVEPQDVENSAMEDERCEAPGCDLPIAAVMLAAYAAQFIVQCHDCRRAYLNHAETPARPCPGHLAQTYRAAIVAAIVDGRPLPTPPWESAPSAGEPFVSAWATGRTLRRHRGL